MEEEQADILVQAVVVHMVGVTTLQYQMPELAPEPAAEALSPAAVVVPVDLAAAVLAFGGIFRFRV
jgi:hypothetical protein